MSSRKRERKASSPVEMLDTIADPKTDSNRWRLKDDRGRQTWHYLESRQEFEQWPMTAADKHYLGLETVSIIPT